MSIFYLEIAKRKNKNSYSDLASSFGLDKYFFYSTQSICFRLYVNSGEVRPKILENDKKLLIVHGNCPNIDLDNYTDLNALYGNFNLICINKDNDECVFVKDFTNSFDSFLFKNEDRIIISNNPLLIAKNGLSLDYHAICQYYLRSTGFFPQNYFYTDIKKIQAGSIIHIDPNVSFKSHQVKAIKKRADSKTFNEAFEDIINKSINSDFSRSISSDLTGGYDTRLITACLLKNQIKFSPVVHGENDNEVKFVKNFAEILNLDIKFVELNQEINSILNNWRYYTFLSGGYYNFFESLKEGGRSSIRSKFSDCKVGGSMGEVLRDGWYLDELHRCRLSETSIDSLLYKFLVDSDSIYKFCTEEFTEILNEFKLAFKKRIRQYLGNTEEKVISQIYMDFIFSHYTQGWNGCLYNFHNNIVSIIGPYVDNQFFLNCLTVDDRFRKNVYGLTRAINAFYPAFSQINLLDGQRCAEIRGTNLIRFLFHNFINNRVRSKFFGYSAKKDYDQSLWLKNLLKDKLFESIIYEPDAAIDFLIGNTAFEKLVKKGSNKMLSKSEYVILWKTISLKLTLKWESIITY